MSYHAFILIVQSGAEGKHTVVAGVDNGKERSIEPVSCQGQPHDSEPPRTNAEENTLSCGRLPSTKTKGTLIYCQLAGTPRNILPVSHPTEEHCQAQRAYRGHSPLLQTAEGRPQRVMCSKWSSVVAEFRASASA